jgi:3-carboxy-cis,cis-muconate cycloisomerase
MKAVFTDEATLQAWLDAEAALARVQARLGVIPREAGGMIEQACALDHHNLTVLGARIAGASHPLTPVIASIEAAAGEAAPFVHYGATTQDIMDTGAVLQVREGLRLVLNTLAALKDACLAQAGRWRSLPMAGRTHGQHAVPITLGLKFALWARDAHHGFTAVSAIRTGLPVQLAGAAGTLATLGDDAGKVRAALAEDLDLRDPGGSWHTSRRVFADTVCQLAIATALCGQIANEIVNLQRTEIGELAEGAAMGAGGSSTMPQKRNPMMAQNVVALARLMATKPAAMIEASMHEHERDMACWTMEWAVIPESFVLAHAALEQAVLLVENIVVDEARIAANLALTGGLICAEAVMMDLAREMGRNEAHHAVKDLIAALPGTGQSFAAALTGHAVIGKLRSPEQIAALLEPANYTGESINVVDRIVAELG